MQVSLSGYRSALDQTRLTWTFTGSSMDPSQTELLDFRPLGLANFKQRQPPNSLGPMGWAFGKFLVK